MRYISRLIVIILIFVSSAVAAQVPADSIALHALHVGRGLPQERVYLHFDNTSYYLGETIWFKAFVTWYGDDTPTELSRVLYVELMSPEGYVVKTNKYKIGEDGTCCGEIYMDPLYLSGYYEVRAYTRYMLNWGDEAIFSRVFPVFDKVNNGDWGFRNIRERDKGFFVNKVLKKDEGPKLAFYPESGHLVHGVESRVAYELTGYKGVDVYDEIALLADGEMVLVTKPQHMGKGSFVLVPQAGVSYTAEVSVADEKGKRKNFKFELPDVEQEGVVIGVNEEDDAFSLHIRNTLADKYGTGLVILHGSDMGYFSNVATGDTLIRVARNDLPEGVCRAVVFRGRVPLAERMFFVQHGDIQPDDKGTVKLKVTGNGYMLHNMEAKPHEKISVVVEREDGKPIDGKVDFAFSVVDQAGKLTTSWGYNLYTYMLLGSEVKGYIPDAYQYFNPENTRRKEHLDLVMLTNGWTAYPWEKLTATDFGDVAAPEDGLVISGKFVLRVADRKSQRLYRVHPQPYNQVRIDYNGGENFIKTQVFRTDRYGRFSILIDDFNGRETVALSPNTVFKHSDKFNYGFFIDKYFSPKPSPLGFWQRNVGSSIRSKADTVSGMKKLQFNEYLLESVNVNADYNKRITNTAPISEMRFDYLDEWEYAMDITFKEGVVDAGGRFDAESVDSYSWLQGTASDGNSLPDLLTLGENLNWKVSEGRERLYQYKDVLSVSLVIESIYSRYDLGWQNWVQPVVVKGEYNKDSIPVADEEHLHGIDVEKMTNFKEIILTSDKKKVESVKGGVGIWERRAAVYINKGAHRFFYDGFLAQRGIAYRLKEHNRIYDAGAVNDLNMLSQRIPRDMIKEMRHPNQVAYLIPDTSNNKTSIQNDLSVASSTRRYTSLRGYSESKQFYSPDYSRELPDDKDYRRTLLWNPSVKAVDGKLQVDFYNSSQCNAIAVDVLGYHDNTIYSNDEGFVTRENAKTWTKKLTWVKEKDLLTDSTFWAECDALFNTAEIYFKKKNYKKALTSYVELAQYNYPKAFYKIGMCYLKGVSLRKRLDLAAQFFEKGAELGMAECYLELSQMYCDGTHYEQSREKEIEVLIKAADLFEPRAMVRLAGYYRSGDGVEKDVEEANRLLRESALLGCADALYEYGVYLSLNGMPADNELGSGVDCITKAAAEKHPDALYWMYRYHVVAGEYKTAYGYVRDLYIKGDVRGTYNLAECCLYGRGVERDRRLAKDLYREAAEKGSEAARKVLAEWKKMK